MCNQLPSNTPMLWLRFSPHCFISRCLEQQSVTHPLCGCKHSRDWSLFCEKELKRITIYLHPFSLVLTTYPVAWPVVLWQSHHVYLQNRFFIQLSWGWVSASFSLVILVLLQYKHKNSWFVWSESKYQFKHGWRIALELTRYGMSSLW